MSAGRIVGWSEFQHYLKRSPPWIKLHKSQVLDNPHWHDLDGDSAKVLVELWLLASETDGNLPSVDVLVFRLRRPKKTIEKALKALQDSFLEDYASTVLATCYHKESRAEAEESDMSADVVEAFERLWAIHHRGSKKRAKEQFQRALRRGMESPEIEEALLAYVGGFRDGFSGAHLERWIKDERWQEYFSEGESAAPAIGGGFYVGG